MRRCRSSLIGGAKKGPRQKLLAEPHRQTHSTLQTQSRVERTWLGHCKSVVLDLISLAAFFGKYVRDYPGRNSLRSGALVISLAADA